MEGRRAVEVKAEVFVNAATVSDPIFIPGRMTHRGGPQRARRKSGEAVMDRLKFEEHY